MKRASSKPLARTRSTSSGGGSESIESAISALPPSFVRYDDIPGVIGRVGTMFGEADVNIANMAVSRTKEGGKALMALSIDTPAPPELVEQLHTVGFDDARFISLAV